MFAVSDVLRVGCIYNVPLHSVVRSPHMLRIEWRNVDKVVQSYIGVCDFVSALAKAIRLQSERTSCTVEEDYRPPGFLLQHITPLDT